MDDDVVRHVCISLLLRKFTHELYILSKCMMLYKYGELE